MTEDVIDLRQIARSKKSPPSETDSAAGVLAAPSFVSWEAYEYEKRERGPYWILFPGGIAVLFTTLGILAQSYFFVAFTVLAFVVLMLYEKRGPQKLQFSADAEGIHIGVRIYPRSDLKSFWIFNRHDGKELSVETSHGLTPYLRIPLGDANPEAIRQVLSKHLPETEHKEFVTDQLARSMGL